MLRLYDFHESGNGYKVRLLLAWLGLPYERVELDILRGETRRPEFLALNPNGRIPLLVLEDGRRLAESNAILFHLAQGTPFWPTSAFEQAEVLQWMFFEQYSHEPYIAVARFIAKYLGLPEARRAEYESKQAGGHKALAVMEAQLKQTPYLAGGQLTTADVSLYAYTHVAGEGGFDLAGYPAIRAWLERIAAQPKYLAMA